MQQLEAGLGCKESRLAHREVAIVCKVLWPNASCILWWPLTECIDTVLDAAGTVDGVEKETSGSGKGFAGSGESK